MVPVITPGEVNPPEAVSRTALIPVMFPFAVICVASSEIVAFNIGYSFKVSIVTFAKNGKNESLTPSLAANESLTLFLKFAIFGVSFYFANDIIYLKTKSSLCL